MGINDKHSLYLYSSDDWEDYYGNWNQDSQRSKSEIRQSQEVNQWKVGQDLKKEQARSVLCFH
jgi:hypothetical protein